MHTLMLWPESQLYAQPPFCKMKAYGPSQVERKAIREAGKRLVAEMQLELTLEFLNSPLISCEIDFTEMSLSLGDDKADAEDIHLTDAIEAGSSVFDWTNGEIRALHGNLFIESMEALKKEDNPDEKLDVLEWVFSPMRIDKLGKGSDGHRCLVRRRVQEIPFSFLNCCLAIGITDPDTFREKLVALMEDDVRPRLEKFLVTLH